LILATGFWQLATAFTGRLHTESQILYLAPMKNGYLLITILFLTACGGRTIDAKLARNLIVDIPQEVFEKEDVEVVNVQQVGRTEAIAETRLKTAIRYEKVGDEWVIREVRMGHGQWEKVGNLMQALETVKIEETRKKLERIAEAVLRYREINGSMPVFKDYISLSDLLSPKYLTPLIRLDAWRKPLGAEHSDANTIQVWSSGSDGKEGTDDDIRKTISP
jgi:hypothetical protein